MRQGAFDQYYEEPKILGDNGMHNILDKGKQRVTFSRNINK